TISVLVAAGAGLQSFGGMPGLGASRLPGASYRSGDRGPGLALGELGSGGGPGDLRRACVALEHPAAADCAPASVEDHTGDLHRSLRQRSAAAADRRSNSRLSAGALE